MSRIKAGENHSMKFEVDKSARYAFDVLFDTDVGWDDGYRQKFIEALGNRSFRIFRLVDGSETLLTPGNDMSTAEIERGIASGEVVRMPANPGIVLPLKVVMKSQTGLVRLERQVDTYGITRFDRKGRPARGIIELALSEGSYSLDVIPTRDVDLPEHIVADIVMSRTPMR